MPVLHASSAFVFLRRSQVESILHPYVELYLAILFLWLASFLRSQERQHRFHLTSVSLQDKNLTSQAAMHIDLVPVYNLEPGRLCNVRSFRGDRRGDHCPLPFRQNGMWIGQEVLENIPCRRS